MSGPTNVDVMVTAEVHDTYDLTDLIRRHQREYAAVHMTGFDEWERPRRFLEDYVVDRVDVGSLTIDEVDVEWKEADFDALCRVCPEADLARQVVPQEVRDRMPGPHDVPLFGGES